MSRAGVEAATPSTGAVLLRVACWIAPAYALLFLPMVVDGLDPGSGGSIDLTGDVALVMWLFAESGQTLGIVVIATALLVVLVTRRGPTPRRRLLELVTVAAVSVVALYGGKMVNDELVKPAIGIARPDIVELAERDALGMTVQEFYDLSQEERSEHLATISTERGFGDVALRPEVRDHWVEETAFSRPSGHALASMTLTTFYLAVAMTWLSGPRRRLFELLVPWAVVVCLSRPILRVHWPADVLIGGLAGIVVGTTAYLLTRALLDRPAAAMIVTGPRDRSPDGPGGSC